MATLLADLIPNGDPSVDSYIALMLAGFVIGIAGHITRFKVLVAIGIGMIFCAVIVLPLLFTGGS